MRLHGSLGSLKEVIEQNWGVDEKPELFCFGLLESFDIKHLAALIAPRPVTFVEPSDRAKSELADLAAWYHLSAMRIRSARQSGTRLCLKMTGTVRRRGSACPQSLGLQTESEGILRQSLLVVRRV